MTDESSSTHSNSGNADVAARVEQRWAVLSIGVIAVIAVMAAYGGIHRATMPQTQVETIDPTTLHLNGEFIESNLGSAIEPNGSVTVRVIGQQYSFTPQCILVPTDTPIIMRATSPDVVHGFLIEGTNVNTMLVPGYISDLPVQFNKPGEHLMPCHEYCGVGHEGMWGKVQVIDKLDFLRLSAKKRRLNCVD
jgi:cytochrome c oxidase subunit 2